VAQAINSINGADARKLYESLLAQAKKRTAIADMQLDDEGKKVKDDPSDSEGVLIVERPAGSEDVPPSQLSKAEAAAIQVASRAKSSADESQTKLIKEPDSNATRRGEASTGKRTKDKKESANRPDASSEASATKEPPPKQKLRMKLVKGKWIRVDEGQSLF